MDGARKSRERQTAMNALRTLDAVPKSRAALRATTSIELAVAS
ncbi:hypothetical protein [Pseudorhizobium marinum]|nr:hypothetical protein [Pseudorhizobium marinum]